MFLSKHFSLNLMKSDLFIPAGLGGAGLGLISYFVRNHRLASESTTFWREILHAKVDPQRPLF